MGRNFELEALERHVGQWVVVRLYSQEESVKGRLISVEPRLGFGRFTLATSRGKTTWPIQEVTNVRIVPPPTMGVSELPTSIQAAS